jgi:hypothetical protein
VTAALSAYLGALSRNDVAGIRAALAPDYSYDGQTAATAGGSSDAPFALTFRSLDHGIEALTVSGNSATTSVTITFQAELNLEPFEFGRPLVSGSGRFNIELERRGAEWKLTAVRPFRIRYAQASTPPFAPRLYDATVNGRTSAEVSPGAPVTLAGKSDLGGFLFASLGAQTATAQLELELEEPWSVTLPAPDTPGRYLAYAFTFIFAADPETREIQVLGADQITLPVTVGLSPIGPSP